MSITMTIVKTIIVLLFLVTVVTASRSYKLSEDVEVVSNGKELENEARAEKSLEDILLGFVQSHDVNLKLPLDAAATVSARNIDNEVMNFKLKLPSDNTEGRGAKKRIKKAMISIAVLLIIKAITLVPLILGILGLKTWNAIQLGIITFFFTFGMGVYEMTKKITVNEPPMIMAPHWSTNRRAFEEELPVADAQEQAYKAYY